MLSWLLCEWLHAWLHCGPQRGPNRGLLRDRAWFCSWWCCSFGIVGGPPGTVRRLRSVLEPSWIEWKDAWNSAFHDRTRSFWEPNVTTAATGTVGYKLGSVQGNSPRDIFRNRWLWVMGYGFWDVEWNERWNKGSKWENEYLKEEITHRVIELFASRNHEKIVGWRRKQGLAYWRARIPVTIRPDDHYHNPHSHCSHHRERAKAQYPRHRGKRNLNVTANRIPILAQDDTNCNA